MRLVFLGAPGVGKGTQAQVYSQSSGVCHISTGEIFRQTIQGGGDLAREISGYIDQGKLVPDDIVLKIVAQRLNQGGCENGFILDGFPRNVRQAEALDGYLDRCETPLDGVVYFEMDKERIVKRLTLRRVCANEKCQATYHLEFRPPEQEGICDRCGQEVIQRNDDKPEVVLRRFEEYSLQTEPLIHYYQQKKLLFKVTAQGSVQEVSGTLEAALAELET